MAQRAASEVKESLAAELAETALKMFTGSGAAAGVADRAAGKVQSSWGDTPKSPS